MGLAVPWKLSRVPDSSITPDTREGAAQLPREVIEEVRKGLLGSSALPVGGGRVAMPKTKAWDAVGENKAAAIGASGDKDTHGSPALVGRSLSPPDS